MSYGDPINTNGASYAESLKTEIVANSSSGTTANVATKAAANALSLVAGQFVRVAADETNNGDKSMYFYTGSTLEFQYTII